METIKTEAVPGTPVLVGDTAAAEIATVEAAVPAATRVTRAKAKDSIPADVVAICKRPLPVKAIKQAPKGLSSIKTIFVTERLNEAFGEGRWFTKAEVVERNDPKAEKEPTRVVVKVILTLVDYPWFYGEAYGGNQNIDLGDSYKGAVSDALGKIAASHFGIGADVYKGEGEAVSAAHEAAEKAAATAAAKANPKDQKAAATAAAVATAQGTVANPPNCEDCLLVPGKDPKDAVIKTYRIKVKKSKDSDELIEKVYDAADLVKQSQAKYKLNLCAHCQAARAAETKAKASRAAA
jgi:hypothetical protein